MACSVIYIANVQRVLYVNLTKNVEIILKRDCAIRTDKLRLIAELKHILLFVLTFVICNFLEVTASDVGYRGILGDLMTEETFRILINK